MKLEDNLVVSQAELHLVKNYLAAAVSGLRTVRQLWPDLSDTGRLELIQMILSQSELALKKHLGWLAAMRVEDYPPTVCRPVELSQKIADNLGLKIKTQADSEIKVLSRQMILEMVIENLLFNVKNHGDPSRPAELSAEIDRNWLYYSLANWPLADSDGANRLRLGIEQSRVLMDRLGGQFEVRRDKSGQFLALFSLPQISANVVADAVRRRLVEFYGDDDRAAITLAHLDLARRLALELFELEEREKMILEVAVLLHDAGDLLSDQWQPGSVFVDRSPRVAREILEAFYASLDLDGGEFIAEVVELISHQHDRYFAEMYRSRGVELQADFEKAENNPIGLIEKLAGATPLGLVHGVLAHFHFENIPNPKAIDEAIDKVLGWRKEGLSGLTGKAERLGRINFERTKRLVQGLHSSLFDDLDGFVGRAAEIDSSAAF